MRTRQFLFVFVLTFAVAWSSVSWAQGINRPITRKQADGFFVNVTGDTMTGTLLVPALMLSGDFSTSTGIFKSTVADGTVGFIFDVTLEHATGNLFEFREVGGSAFFKALSDGRTQFAESAIFNKNQDVRGEILNNGGGNTCNVSGTGVCIGEAVDINGDIIDSRTDSPVTIADVDGLKMTAGDVTLTAVDVLCVTSNTCNIGSSSTRFNSVFASDLFSDRINARGTSVPVKIVEPDGLEVTGPTTFFASLTTTGTDPTLSACGTSPSIVGSDTAGKVSIGTGTVTSCIVTFATAFANNPACVITGDSTGLDFVGDTLTTRLRIRSGVNMAEAEVSYICVGL